MPQVVWTKVGGDIPATSHRSCPHESCLTLTSVTRHDSGVYTCSANNGVGHPDSAEISLTVQCQYQDYDVSTLNNVIMLQILQSSRLIRRVFPLDRGTKSQSTAR